MRVGVVLGRVACASLALACLGMTAAAPPPPQGGYALPVYGAEEVIWDVYTAADGHFVVEFVYRDAAGVEDDFFDTRTGQRLYPTQNRALATDNALKAKLVQAAGLTIHRRNDMTGVPDGKLITVAVEGGRLCEPVPYLKAVSVSQPGQEPVKFAVFTRRSTPWTLHPQHGCGPAALTTRYASPNPGFYTAGPAGFFAKLDGLPYLIWFDWNGHSTFFRHRADVIQVPFAEISKILRDSRDDHEVPSQTTYLKIEALIETYARRQMNENTHG